MSAHPLESLIEAAFERRTEITPTQVDADVLKGIEQVIADLDAGFARLKNPAAL